MTNKDTIIEVEKILQDLECRVGDYFTKQTLSKVIWALEMYNRFVIQIYSQTGHYPPDFYYHINNGIVGVLNYYYSLQRRNLVYRESDKLSSSNKELCYDTLLDFARINECREYYLISDIEVQDKFIHIKPFTSNMLEVFDFYRDQDYYFSTGLNQSNKVTFSSINSNREDLLDSLLEFYQLVINNSGIEPGTKMGGVQFSAYVMTLFYLITLSYEQSNYIIDNDFCCEYIKIFDIRSLKNELLKYINTYHKKLNPKAEEIARADIDTISKVMFVNFDNYKTALIKGHIDRLFIQLNDKLCTFITKYAPTEYLPAFSYLNRLLCEYFPDDYNCNRDVRENFMYSKLADCLSKENIQSKQGIKLRSEGKTLTDIDAVVYDSKENTVYFVQFKYQDDFVRDIRAKRNQVQRVKKQISQWFDAIKSWLKNHKLESFLKDCHFTNVQKEPDLKYIIFTQYNINQLLVEKLKKDTIYVSDSLFYLTYSETGALKKLFETIYKQNRNPIKELEHNNEKCYICDYEIFYDYNARGTLEIQNRWHQVQNEEALDITNLF